MNVTRERFQRVLCDPLFPLRPEHKVLCRLKPSKWWLDASIEILFLAPMTGAERVELAAPETSAVDALFDSERRAKSRQTVATSQVIDFLNVSCNEPEDRPNRCHGNDP